MPYLGFLWKALLVAVTLGSGFYGGLITEQFVMGAVVGGAFAHVFALQPALGAAVGLVAVVAAASNTPIAAILMGVELLGGDSTLYVAGACIAAYLVVGHRSVYPEQQIAATKSSWMAARADVLVSEEKVRLSRELVRWWHDRRLGGPPAPTEPPDDKLGKQGSEATPSVLLHPLDKRLRPVSSEDKGL